MGTDMLYESLNDMAESLIKNTNVLKLLVNDMNDFLIKIQTYPHKRSYYLMHHGSPRVRKKNLKRYRRWFKKEILQRSCNKTFISEVIE